MTFQGKVEGKKIMGFLAQKPAYDVLVNAQAGEVYDVTVVKENGFNNWTSATKSAAGASPAATPAGGTISGAKPAYTPTASPKSTYETPEERAKKQIYIVRQSSVGSAIELLSVGSKTRPDIKEVLETAKQIEDFVFGNALNADVDTTFGDLDNLDDVPM